MSPFSNIDSRIAVPSHNGVHNLAGLASGMWRGIFFSKLRHLQHGHLVVREGKGRWHFGPRQNCDTHHLVVHDPGFYTSVVLGGSLGAAESYILGQWSTDDLASLLGFVLANADTLEEMDRGLGKILTPMRKFFHLLRPNTICGSRLNISAHYDFGNDFFARFLDSSMMYSCAYFSDPKSSLEEASLTKIERICEKLNLQPSDRVLEIGSGWGALAVYVAKNYGAKVTTTTISREQFKATVERVKRFQVDDRVAVLMRDYRELTGSFDKVIAIEMIEAVGWRHYSDFFRTCSRLLRPDGEMMVQAIVIEDQRYEMSKNHVDFIKRYIFPGSCIPSIACLCEAMATSSNLRLTNLEDMTPHYVQTLEEWLRRFHAEADFYRSVGISDAMLRLWEYYFNYCIAGFSQRRTRLVQLLFSKPDCRRSLRMHIAK